MSSANFFPSDVAEVLCNNSNSDQNIGPGCERLHLTNCTHILSNKQRKLSRPNLAQTSEVLSSSSSSSSEVESDPGSIVWEYDLGTNPPDFQHNFDFLEMSGQIILNQPQLGLLHWIY